jgi:hypothetical protein
MGVNPMSCEAVTISNYSKIAGLCQEIRVYFLSIFIKTDCMNERIAHTEDKLKTIVEMMQDQTKTPSSYDSFYLTKYEKVIAFLKSSVETWGEDHPDVKLAIKNECTEIEDGLDQLANRHKLFEQE